MRPIVTFLAGLGATALAIALPAAASESVFDSSAGPVTVTRMADGLDEPWAVGFLPGGGYLVTERSGRLLHFDDEGNRQEVAGVPAVYASGQGGLLDILVPRDFVQTRDVYISYAVAQDGGAGTALGVGRLSQDGARLEGFRQIFESAPGFSGGRHFGSRIAEGPEGYLFLTVGERGAMESAQDRTNHNGTIVRLSRDGSVPDDNPFVGEAGMQPEIWTWGHRNPQGLDFDSAGRLWSNEHGPQGGDELNIIEPGNNYGWPLIGESRHYSGAPMAEGREMDGMERPLAHWTPALAPSGLVAYSGALWPEWEGSLFNGSLQQDRIARIDPGADYAEESLQSPEMVRVRDVREVPDGAIWFLSAGNGALYRMAPDDGG
jgi:aldose sugar dehydrogenase